MIDRYYLLGIAAIALWTLPGGWVLLVVLPLVSVAVGAIAAFVLLTLQEGSFWLFGRKSTRVLLSYRWTQNFHQGMGAGARRRRMTRKVVEHFGLTLDQFDQDEAGRIEHMGQLAQRLNARFPVMIGAPLLKDFVVMSIRELRSKTTADVEGPYAQILRHAWPEPEPLSGTRAIYGRINVYLGGLAFRRIRPLVEQQLARSLELAANDPKAMPGERWQHSDFKGLVLLAYFQRFAERAVVAADPQNVGLLPLSYQRKLCALYRTLFGKRREYWTALALNPAMLKSLRLFRKDKLKHEGFVANATSAKKDTEAALADMLITPMSDLRKPTAAKHAT